jgi:hypothetical protein
MFKNPGQVADAACADEFTYVADETLLAYATGITIAKRCSITSSSPVRAPFLTWMPVSFPFRRIRRYPCWVNGVSHGCRRG